MIVINRQKMRGLILVPILLTLTLVAVVAVMINRQSTIQAENFIRTSEPAQINYVGDAALAIAEKTLNEDQDCKNYSVPASGTFAGKNYTTTISPTSGSPVKIVVDVDNGNGTNSQFTSEVSMYQPERETVINVSADSYLDQQNKSSKFGSNDKMEQKSALFAYRRSLLYFDLSSNPFTDEIIQQADMELYLVGAAEDNTEEVSAYALTNSWDESKVTWDKRTSSYWDTSGGDYLATEYARTLVDENTPGIFKWDITGLTQAWVNNEITNHGVILRNNSVNYNNLEFASKEYSDSAQHPVLRIQSRCECGKACEIDLSCNADFTPAVRESEFSTAGGSLNSYNPKGITFLPEGATFNGNTAGEDGAWLFADDNTSKIYMTATDGTYITEIFQGFSHQTAGITYISKGSHAGRFATTETWTKPGVIILDDTGTEVITYATSIMGAEGITFMETTGSGTYDEHFAVISIMNKHVYFVDQSGAINHSVDISSFTNTPKGIAHIPDTDKLLVVDEVTEDVITIDTAGSELSRYSISGFGADLPNGIAINAVKCNHVFAESNADKIISLGRGTPASVTLNPVADTYLRESKKNNEYGNDDSFRLGRRTDGTDYQGLIQFDLSSIPSNATITSVTLRAKQRSDSGSATAEIGAYRMTSSWDESSANWNNISGTSYYEGTQLAETTLTASTDWAEWTLPTSLLSDWMSGSNPNYGLALVYEEPDEFSIRFYSREESDSDRHPELVVEYATP